MIATPLRLRSLAELLREPGALEPPAAVVPRLAWAGCVTLVAGREKLAGKSTLLTAAAAAVTAGRPFLGAPPRPGTVLWVSADLEPPRVISERAARFGADPERLFVLWPGAAPYGDLRAALERLPEAPVLVIIDTLVNFVRAHVERVAAADDWATVLLPLRELAQASNLAIALSHHAKKDGSGYRDSTAIGANVDALVTVVADDPDHPALRRVEVVARWWAEPFALELGSDDEYRVTTAPAAPISGAALARAAILDAMRAAPGRVWTTREVGEVIGRSPDRALAHLRALAALRPAPIIRAPGGPGSTGRLAGCPDLRTSARGGLRRYGGAHNLRTSAPH